MCTLAHRCREEGHRQGAGARGGGGAARGVGQRGGGSGQPRQWGSPGGGSRAAQAGLTNLIIIIGEGRAQAAACTVAVEPAMAIQASQRSELP